MNGYCPPCGALLTERGLRKGLGIDWQCARCGAAGAFIRGRVGTRNVLVRQQTVAGDPALRLPWVPAELLTYAERVRV